MPIISERERIDGLLALYGIQTPAKEKELASLKRGIAEIESKLALVTLPAAIGVLVFSFFHESKIFLGLAIGLMVASGAVCGYMIRTLQLAQRAKAKEIFFKEMDKGMEGKLGDLDARLLNFPELKESGVGEWMQSRLGERVSETARALAGGFEGTLSELFKTAKVLEEKD